jgi:thymidine kinase
MNENVARVLRGFLNLTTDEKAEFIRELNRYQGLQYDFQQKAFMEQVETRADSVGPKNSICSCCGR